MCFKLVQTGGGIAIREMGRRRAAFLRDVFRSYLPLSAAAHDLAQGFWTFNAKNRYKRADIFAGAPWFAAAKLSVHGSRRTRGSLWRLPAGRFEPV
jgi:hypothetical protein